MSRISRKKILILSLIFSIFFLFNSPAYSVKASSSTSYNLVEKWKYQAKKGDYLQEIKFDDDDEIVFLTNGGDHVSYIYALDPDGELIWDYYFRDDDFDEYFVTEDYIYLISKFNLTENVMLIDKETGRREGTLTLELEEDEFINEIAIDYDGNMYVTTEDSFIIFDEDGDREREYEMEIPYDFLPVVGPNGTVYIMEYFDKDDRYKLHAIRSTGSIKWSTKYLRFNGGDFTSDYSDYPIMFDKDGIIYIKDDYIIYSIDDGDGDINWQYTFSEDEEDEFYYMLEPDPKYYGDVDSSRSQYLVNKFNNTVIIKSDYAIIALDAKDGDELWNYDRGRYYLKEITEVDDTVYAIFDKLYVFNEDGDIEWDFDIKSESSYVNLDLQVDALGNIYLYEYENSKGTGILYFLDEEGEAKWETRQLPAERHEWFMTDYGPIYKTYKYQNGQYESELYTINSNGEINKIKVDGTVVDIIDKGGYIYVLTNNNLYALKYLSVPLETENDTNVDIPSEVTEDNSSICYNYADYNNPNSLSGYNLAKDWGYDISKDDYDFNVSLDKDNNIYLAAMDQDEIEYIYSLDNNGKLNWKHNLNGEDLNGFFISDNYVHVYDTNFNNDDFILLDKETGKEERTFRLNFSESDNEGINDIIVDSDGNMYIFTAEGIIKYNIYGKKSWDLDLEISPSTKSVLGPKDIIYSFEYVNDEKYKLHAINTNGSKKWSTYLYFKDYSLDDIDTPIIFDEDGTLYILNSEDNTLYSIDPEDGDINFKHISDDPINILLKQNNFYIESQGYNRSDYLVNKIDDKIILYSDNEVYALDASRGWSKWNFEKDSNRHIKDIEVQGEKIYFITDKLYVLNKNGYKLWEYELNSSGYYENKMIINDYGLIYIFGLKTGNKNSTIHAISDIGKLEWKAENITITNNDWFLAKNAPIYFTKINNDTELNTINRDGFISKYTVEGNLIEILEKDDNIYVLTDEQLFAFTHSFENVSSSKIIKCNENNNQNNNYENSEKIRLYINGIEQASSDKVIMVNGRTLVPVRQVFEELGGVVKYDDKSNSVTISNNESIIYLKAGSDTATVNGKTVSLDVKAQIINGSFMIPLRFVGEALGAEVKWDNSTQSIFINTK